MNFRAIAIQRTLRESGNQGREPSRAAEDVTAKLEGTDLVDSIAFHQNLLKACFAEPVVSKPKMITDISIGKVRHRLIMDRLMSKVNSTSKQAEGVVLPRIADLVYDVFLLLMGVSPKEGPYPRRCSFWNRLCRR